MDGWYELGLYVAWHMAMFQRAEKLPPLKTVIEQFTKAVQAGPVQDPRAQFHVMQSISARLGIPLQHRARKKKGDRT